MKSSIFNNLINDKTLQPLYMKDLEYKSLDEVDFLNFNCSRVHVNSTQTIT